MNILVYVFVLIYVFNSLGYGLIYFCTLTIQHISRLGGDISRLIAS